MRDLSSAVVSAVQERVAVARDFLWIEARNRTNGATESLGLWSDVGNVAAPVIDGLTGATVTRDFIGSGAMVGVGDIPLTSGIAVREVEIALSQIDESVAQAVRGYDCKAAPIQIHRGYFNPATRNLVGPAVPRFVGFVNEIEIVTPAEGQEGSITLRCVSHTVELTRASTETRSDASQQRRAPGDSFYEYTGVVGEWEIFWGKKNGKIKG